LKILTARKSVSADCGPRIRFPFRLPVMVANSVWRPDGKEGGVDARSLYEQWYSLWCRRVAKIR
jgi:hypothetical protein